LLLKRLPQEFEVSKADQADILNKSIQFFKEKDNFNLNDFTNEVIDDSKAIEVFKQYKTDFEQDAYSGDTRSPFPVISVHFLFIFSLAGVKLILFS
jgi:hypothetical protein